MMVTPLKKTAASLIVILLSQLACPAIAAEVSDCPINQQLTEEESSDFYLFNAELTGLRDVYGQPNFEDALSKIVQTKWPKTKLVQISPTFYERVRNLLDQARLRDSVARTIGLENPAWLAFDHTMRDITLSGGAGLDLLNPFEKVSYTLLQALHDDHLMPKLLHTAHIVAQ